MSTPATNAASYFLYQCTRFVASVLSWVPAHWGNADTWYPNAQAQGYATGSKPMVGAVAAWGSSGTSPAGHVAEVTQVNADGSFVVQEANYDLPAQTYQANDIDSRTVPAGGGSGFDGFIYGPPGTTTPSAPSGNPVSNLIGAITQPVTSAAGSAAGGLAGDLTGAVTNGVNAALDQAVTSALGGVSGAAGAAGQDVRAYVNNNLIALGAAAAVTAVVLWRFQVEQ